MIRTPAHKQGQAPLTLGDEIRRMEAADRFDPFVLDEASPQPMQSPWEMLERIKHLEQRLAAANVEPCYCRACYTPAKP
jgi:hypothetical protein